MATVWIPVPLRHLTNGEDRLSVTANRLDRVIAELDRTFPGLRERLCHGDALRPGLAAAVDGEVARLGLLQPVGPTSEVHFLPALGGGAVNSRLTTTAKVR